MTEPAAGARSHQLAMDLRDCISPDIPILVVIRALAELLDQYAEWMEMEAEERK